MNARQRAVLARLRVNHPRARVLVLSHPRDRHPVNVKVKMAWRRSSRIVWITPAGALEFEGAGVRDRQSQPRRAAVQTVTQIKRRILAALREHEGHASCDELAAALDEAPFRVRAELDDMARPSMGPLVRATWTRRRQEYELTDAGEVASWGTQERLF